MKLVSCELIALFVFVVHVFKNALNLQIENLKQQFRCAMYTKIIYGFEKNARKFWSQM